VEAKTHVGYEMENHGVHDGKMIRRLVKRKLGGHNRGRGTNEHCSTSDCTERGDGAIDRKDSLVRGDFARSQGGQWFRTA